MENLIRGKKTIRLDSVLFSKLHEKGGYSLIAIYCELKAFRNKPERYIPIKHTTNRKISTGYSLLKICTGISINTLKKNVPLLIEMNLGHFDTKGGFFLHGNNKTRLSIKKKMVPIQIGKSFTDTRLSAKFVIISSNLRRQSVVWKKKETLRELFKVACSNDGFISKKELTILNQAHQDGIDLRGLKPVKNSILSNKRIYELISGRIVDSVSGKSSGKYIKNRFKKMGWIHTRRRFKDFFGRYVAFKEYAIWKAAGGKARERISWRKGRIVQELCSEVIDLSSNFLSFSKDLRSLQTFR